MNLSFKPKQIQGQVFYSVAYVRLKSWDNHKGINYFVRLFSLGSFNELSTVQQVLIIVKIYFESSVEY